MRIPAHTITPGVEPAGNVHHNATGIFIEPFRHQPVEHDRSCNNAAVHGGILIRKRKIVVEVIYYLLRFGIVNGAARSAFLGAGVYCLQHGLRNARKPYFFAHITSSPLSVFL